MRFVLRVIFFNLALLVIITTLTAVAAANTVPATRADSSVVSFQIDHLRPPACAGLTLLNLVSGSGSLNGTEGNDLILASAGADTINGFGGSDCIVSGGGDDMIDGGIDADICIGGDGSDIFINCEGEG